MHTKKFGTNESKPKILIVCSKNSGQIAPFITDQVEALEKAGIHCDYFTIEGKGIKGYLKCRPALLKKMNEFQPEIVHAHYGLSGLLANTQRKIPVVTTYHGSDINIPQVFVLSRINMLLSAFNIFVSQKNIEKSCQKRNFALIPCGVDTDVFYPMDKEEARRYFRFQPDEKLVLFAGHFQNAVKNPVLAQEAVSLLSRVKLLELKGYNRQEVALLMNAVDVCLMTSHTEGSPQFIKEAMACNCPVVSVKVGDVEEIINDIEHCYLIERNAQNIAVILELILNSHARTAGRKKIELLKMEQKQVVKKLNELYKEVIRVTKKRES